MKHIVLVTYGEPITPAFVEQLVYSWRILLGLTRTVADIPAPLIPVIALSRARGRNALWKKHDYSSPLEPITLAQAAQLRNALAQQTDDRWKIHVAYEFRDPLLSTVIGQLPRDETVVVVPMYAADSSFTHELSRTTVRNLNQGRTGADDRAAGHRHRSARARLGQSRDARAWIRHGHDQHGGAGAGRARHLVEAVEADRDRPARHGAVAVPHRAAVIGLLRHCRQRLAEPHARRQWTDPPIEEALKRVSDAGFRDVVYYPYGFLADNAESQLEGQLAAAGRPELKVRFVQCLNGSPDLAQVIASQVLAAHEITNNK